MRYSLPVKFIAILLTALSLVVCVGSVIGIVQLVNYNLYNNTVDEWLQNGLSTKVSALAEGLAEKYAIENETNCTPVQLNALGFRSNYDNPLSWSSFGNGTFSYTISTAEAGLLYKEGAIEGKTLTFTTTVRKVEFPVLVSEESKETSLEKVDTRYEKDQLLRSEETTMDGYEEPVTIRYYASPKYTVSVTMTQAAAMNPFGTSVAMVELLHSLRYTLIVTLAISVVLFACGAAYLSVVAGKRSRHTKVSPAAINRIPLDLYAAGGTLIVVPLLTAAIQLIYNWTAAGKDYNPGTLTLSLSLFFGVALVFLGFLYAVVTQIKLSDFYWWRHSFLYWLGRSCGDLLPVAWQFLLCGCALLALCVFCALFAAGGHILPLCFALALTLGCMIYFAYAFTVLLKGAKRMSQGDLNDKVDTRFLVGAFRQCADYLNTLAEVAIVAAHKQMQADRMKTELITNVSHDIKTPLTSIINYVDILQHLQKQEDAKQCLEVLGRQSQRLKKLIEDLMELSKASSGAMTANIIPLNATETVTQALGEFSDKLENADLQVVFQPPQENMTILADGRMSWRVLSNLLSNVVKYALPGTRVYIEVAKEDSYGQISVKNISREPLNITTEELTERFVRGDASRHTEGSGLGLNIAKSLMELQQGKLDLTIDGDLFKATAHFPLQTDSQS